ncbi:unnamed protein product [Closterium sp. NIES-53]
MATLRVLTFDPEGRPIQFDTWLDDLQLYLLSDSRDGVSLFDLTSGASLAPPDIADSANRSQWLTRDAAARLAVRNHLPLAERTHFGQHKIAKALAVRDLFLAMDPTDLTVDLLEKHLLAAEASIVNVGAACGTPRTPFFEGCSPSPLAPSFASAAAVDFLRVEEVGAASAPSGRRPNGKGKGGKGGGGGSGGGGGGSGGGDGGGGGGQGSGGGSGGVGGGGGGSSGSGGGGSGGGRDGTGQRGGSGGGQRQQQQHPRETSMRQELREWFAQRGASMGQSVDIFALDYDAIPAAMYALTVSAEGDCYLCVLPDPGIEAATLGASEYALPGTAPAEALHTFTLDSGASCCFFRDNTIVTPLPAPVAVRLANPSGGPILAYSSTVLPCPAVPSGSLSGLHLPSFSTNLVSTAALQDAMVTTTTPGGQRVSIGTCTRTGRHLAMFTSWPGSSLYTLTTDPPQVAVSGQVSASGLCLPSHPRLSLPAFPVSRGGSVALLTPPRFPPMTAPLQTLHMDVWGGPPRGRSLIFLSFAVESGAGGGGATRGVVSGGAELERAEPGGAEPGVAESEGVEPGGAEPERVEPGGASPGVAMSEGAEPGGPTGASSWQEPLSPPQLREWFARRSRLRSGIAGAGEPATGGTRAGGTGAAGPGGAGAAGPGGARTGGTGVVGDGGAAGAGARDLGAGGAGAGGTGGSRAAGPGGARSGGTRATGASGSASTQGTGGAGGAGAAGPGGARTGGTGAGAAEGARAGDPVAGDPGAGGAGPGGAGAVDSPLTAPSPYTEQPNSLTERRAPESRPASPVRAVRTGRLVPRLRPPHVPGTHGMALRPSSIPLRIPLSSPAASSLPDIPDPESDSVRAAIPTVTRLLATIVIDPSFESTAASALVAELVDFVAACRLNYAASLVAESKSICPPSVGGECALGTDVLEDRQEDFECFATAVPHLVAMLLAPEGDSDALDIPTPRYYAEAITGPYSSQWQTAIDAEMASWKSTGTYVESVPPPGANIVDGMWIFRVKWPPGSPPVFKTRYVVRGFSQRQGVDFFQTFSPTPKMTTLRVLLHVAAQCDYELHSLDFSIAFLQGSLHKEIWLRRPPGFTGSFPAGTQWSLRRPVYGLRQAPREWHDTLRTSLAALWFTPSTADPSLFLRSDTSLLTFYILVCVDDLVFAMANTEALALVKSELQKRHTCSDLGELRSNLGLHITRARARCAITLTQSHMVHQVLQRFGFRFSSPQSTPLPIGHSLSAPPSDESIEPSGLYPELVGCLMYLMTCTRPDLAYPLSILACYVAPDRHRPEH